MTSSLREWTPSYLKPSSIYHLMARPSSQQSYPLSGKRCVLSWWSWRTEVTKAPSPAPHLNVSLAAAKRPGACLSIFLQALLQLPRSLCGTRAQVRRQKPHSRDLYPASVTSEKALCFSSAGWFVDGHISGAPPTASPDGNCLRTYKSPLDLFSPQK